MAHNISDFFPKNAMNNRIQADERRWAISMWLLIVLATLAWTALVATGLALHHLVS